MSWQDVRGHYEVPDDDEAGEVELAEKTCWWCSRQFAGPAAECERFCSMECDNAWCAKSEADMLRALGGYLGANAVGLRAVPPEEEIPF